MRLKIIRVLITVLFLAISLELFYVQVIKGNFYFNLSKNNSIRVVPLQGWRGRIFDRNGIVLSDNRVAYNIMVVPQETQDFDQLFAFIASILNQPAEKIKDRYNEKRMAPFAPVLIAEDIAQHQAIAIEENKFRFPSVYIEETYKRYYPLGSNSAHVLGYIGKQSKADLEKIKEYGYSPSAVIGKTGVEKYYDNYLRGVDGGLQIEVNSRGKQVRLLSVKQPTKGQDLVLTIDSKLQQMMEEVLGTHAGSMIVMNIQNGEILGLVNSPFYDPNVFANPQDSEQISSLFTNPAAPLLNRAVSAEYPPGSVFKVVSALGGLDMKKINPQTSFQCKGSFTLGGIQFDCTHVHGMQNLAASLAHSCNVYYYMLGPLLGVDNISRYANQLGLGHHTLVDLPYEKDGLIPSQRQRIMAGKGRMFAGDTLNISIGQGDVLTTPIQLLRMMATIARSGVEVQPHVIQSIGGKAVEQYQFQRSVNIPEDVFKSVQQGLRAAVTEYSGTANALSIENLFVAGKTGTAQTTANKPHHAWFVGYATGTNLQIAFCVFLEYGGMSQNATLLGRDLLMRMRDAQIL